MYRLKSITGKPTWCCSKTFWDIKINLEIQHLIWLDSTLTHSMYCVLFLSSGFCLSPLKLMSDVLFFRLPESQQRVGGFFLSLMPQMRALYNSYCSNHPSAVNVLTQHRYTYKIYCENLFAINLFCPCILFWWNIFWLNSNIFMKLFKPTQTGTMMWCNLRAFLSWNIYPAYVNIVDRHRC